jgi:hypothetical protein
MPLKSIDLTNAPGFLIQACVGCAGEHRINLDRGAVETKSGPFVLAAGDTLDITIDGAAAPVTVVVALGDFPDLANVIAAQLAARLASALSAATVSVEGDCVLIESKTTGPNSSVAVASGTARAALGFPIDGRLDPCSGRPVLGVSIGGRTNKDAICLRRCGSDANEVLHRTWDVAPEGLAGTPFYEQRRAVNALAQYFKAQGWVHPALAAELGAETVSPPDLAPSLAGGALSPPLPGPPGAGSIGGGV